MFVQYSISINGTRVFVFFGIVHLHLRGILQNMLKIPRLQVFGSCLRSGLMTHIEIEIDLLKVKIS